MNTDRTKRVKKSVVTTLLLQIVTVICGLIVPRLMIDTYGSEAYGATSSISQFLSYITLLEGGIGGVARAALYKPLAEKDKERISVIVFELKRYFKIIAYISIVYAFLLAVFFKPLSKIECYDWLSTFMLVLAMAVSIFGQYFIGISYSALIQADQRLYIINSFTVLTTLLNTIMIVIMIRLGSSLILAKLVSSCVFLIKPTVMWLYVKKHYGLVRIHDRDRSALSQKWTGLGQHIAFYIHSNTDVAVLTILDSLKTVSVYSVYTMVTNHIQSIIVALCSGMSSLFGDMIARNEQQNLNNTFNFYETLTSVACTILFSTVYVMIVPFIRIYTSGIEDINYIQPRFAILITAASELYCFRIPYQSIITSAGHFKQTRFGAYGEASINLTVSVILVWRLGLIGVAIGTIAAICFRLLYCVYYLNRQIIWRSMAVFIKRVLVNIGITLVIYSICSRAIKLYNISNYPEWISCAIITVIIASIVSMIGNIIFFKENTKRLLCAIISWFKDKRKKDGWNVVE